jgi:DNA-binding NtrC family response regulator
MAKAKLKVLYSEGEEDILKEQSTAMTKAGHTVQQAIGRKAVEAALKTGSFDLVVLGPTLTRNDRHHLPYMVKKANAETSVLVMHADGSRHPYVDACTDTGSSMEHVLARMESMTITGMMPAAAAAARAGR